MQEVLHAVEACLSASSRVADQPAGSARRQPRRRPPPGHPADRTVPYVACANTPGMLVSRMGAHGRLASGRPSVQCRIKSGRSADRHPGGSISWGAMWCAEDPDEQQRPGFDPSVVPDACPAGQRSRRARARTRPPLTRTSTASRPDDITSSGHPCGDRARRASSGRTGHRSEGASTPGPRIATPKT